MLRVKAAAGSSLALCAAGSTGAAPPQAGSPMFNVSRHRLLTWSVTALVVCAFLLVDFFTPSQFYGGRKSMWLQAILIGICIGQLNLLAAWAAFAPGNVMLRLPWTLLLSVLSWYALVLGNRVTLASFAGLSLRSSLENAILLGGVLLVGVIAAQIPLWIASRGLGFRLVQRLRLSAVRGNQFQLRHLLVGMLLLCVALAPLREVLPHGDRFNVGALYLYRLSVVVTAAAVCNLLITLPCLWGAFLRMRTLLFVAAGWPLYAALLTFAEMIALYAILGDPIKIDEMQAVYLCNLTQCVAVTGVLLIFRAIGFRLVRVDRQEKLPPPDTAPA